jgi:hypothetical protein
MRNECVRQLINKNQNGFRQEHLQQLKVRDHKIDMKIHAVTSTNFIVR